MALVKKLKEQTLERDVPHKDVDCTYSIVDGNFLQIDTYGSGERKMPGKKSQSIRFTRKAIEQLKDLLRENF